MRFLMMLVLAVACGDKDSGPGPATCGEAPTACECIVTKADTYDESCDCIRECYCDPDTNEWQSLFCEWHLGDWDASLDAQIDAAPETVDAAP